MGRSLFPTARALAFVSLSQGLCEARRRRGPQRAGSTSLHDTVPHVWMPARSPSSPVWSPACGDPRTHIQGSQRGVPAGWVDRLVAVP